MYIFRQYGQDMTRSVSKWRDFAVNTAEVSSFLYMIKKKSSVENKNQKEGFFMWNVLLLVVGCTHETSSPEIKNPNKKTLDIVFFIFNPPIFD